LCTEHHNHQEQISPPLISELVSQLYGAWYFTKLDVHWGFNNVHIKPEDEWKVAFYTNHGLFKPLVMFFDILIFTRTKEEHEQAVQRVLEILTEHKLFLHLEKYEFHWKQIEYLRLVIPENKVVMDPVQVAGVHEWPVPEN